MGSRLFYIASFAFILAAFFGCSRIPNHQAYQAYYSHLKKTHCHYRTFQETPYYLVILVNARHLDYTNCRCLLKTLAKHPSDGSKNGDVGHAWILLKGIKDGESIEIEGGHSGELGIWQPRYMEGVLENISLGSEDPVRYLFCSQTDGFFQSGNGGHEPSIAVKIDLTPEQFESIYVYIATYDFQEYSITKKQCCSFVNEISAFAGISFEDQQTLYIDQWADIDGQWVKMWTNPCYNELRFGSPDVLEKSLLQCLEQGAGENALPWYQRTHKICLKRSMKRFCNDAVRFPERLNRCLLLFR